MSKTDRPSRPRTTRPSPSGKVAVKRSRPAKPASKAKGGKAAKRTPAQPAVAARVVKTEKPRKQAAPRLPADVKLAIAAAQEKQAIDLTVLDLRNDTAFTDFFVVCTGANARQVQAIADGIEASLKTAGQKPALVEGYNRGEWVLLDYFTFIVHIFLPTRRAFYALERLWGGAEPIEVSEP